MRFILPQEIKSKLSQAPPIVGIAPNAFPRTVPACFVPNYRIVCFKWRAETAVISNDIPLFCVEKENPEINLEKVNAKEILKLDVVQRYISQQDGVWLLVYKSTPGIEELADKFGWKIIGNRTEIKDKYENKKAFREALLDSGINPIEGETIKVSDFMSSQDIFSKLKKKYGTPVVFQIAEMTEGGGTGTAFVNDEEEFKDFVNRVKEKIAARKKPTLFINATRFLKGYSASIAACVTKHGVISSRIQTQIQDVADVRLLSEGSGLFCGHDWSVVQYEDRLQKQASEIAIKFGEYLWQKGYKGIFGLDLIVDTKIGKVYPIECNPRYTDAFPVLSMMHMASGLSPMDVYHILEHLGIDYDLDIEELSKQYLNTPLTGSQIILETKSLNWTKTTGQLKAGIYKWYGQNLDYVREGYRYDQLHEGEFLITEGVPFVGTIYKPGARVMRLIFKESILEDTKKLTSRARKIIQEIYKHLGLVSVAPPDWYNENK